MNTRNTSRYVALLMLATSLSMGTGHTAPIRPDLVPVPGWKVLTDPVDQRHYLYVTIANIGTDVASASTTRVTIVMSRCRTMVEYARTPSIPPGATVQVRVLFPSFCDGWYTFEYEADYQDLVKEIDEANNKHSETHYIS